MLTANVLKSRNRRDEDRDDEAGDAVAVGGGDDELGGDRDPRHGADDAPVDERPPVHLVAVGVRLLLHEPEEDHRRVRPEQGDQGDELADPGEHRDQHDHERRAERVLPPARRIDPARNVRLVPAARPPAAQREVIDRGEQQERGDQPVDPHAAEARRAVVAGAGRAGQERRRDRERGGRRDREQDDRLQRVHRADDDVQTAQPGGRRGVELGWRGIGHVPRYGCGRETDDPRGRDGVSLVSDPARIPYDADLALKGPRRMPTRFSGSLSIASVTARSKASTQHSAVAARHGCRRSRDAASTGATTTCPATSRAAHLHGRRVPTRAAGACRRMAPVAGRPGGAPPGRRRL